LEVGMSADYGVREAVLYLAKALRCFRTAKLMSVVFLAQHDVDVVRRVVYEYRCGGPPPG
jgi:hypothetical protein